MRGPAGGSLFCAQTKNYPPLRRRIRCPPRDPTHSESSGRFLMLWSLCIPMVGQIPHAGRCKLILRWSGCSGSCDDDGNGVNLPLRLYRRPKAAHLYATPRSNHAMKSGWSCFADQMRVLVVVEERPDRFMAAQNLWWVRDRGYR